MPRMNYRKNVNKNAKAKNFTGSLKRLLYNLKPWKIIMMIALILAMISSVMSLVSPNKLSDLTDILTEGIKPDINKIEKISSKIQNNFTEENIIEKSNEIFTSTKISQEEKIKFKKALSNQQQMNINEIPNNILHIIMEEIEIDGKVITVNDQIKIIDLFKTVSEEITTKEAISLISKLPPNVYEIVKPKIDMKKVMNISIFLLILYITGSILSYLENYLTTTASNKFAKKLRKDISNKINKLPLNYFDKHESGDTLSIITNDVSTIAQNLNNSLASLVSAITLLIGSIFMMIKTNWVMAITAMLSSLLGIGIILIILKKSQKYFIAKQEQLGDLNGYIEEMYDSHNIIKAYNAKDEVLDKFNDLNKKLYKSNRKSQFLSGLMQPIMMFVGNFGYVSVCIVGALLTRNNYITFGVIVAFMIYVRLFTNPLAQIAQAMTSLQITTAASERVFEFIDEQEVPVEKSKIQLDKTKVKGKIEFKNVKFGYDNKRTIIKDFNLIAKPGQKIAIVGPTGAGKTTLVNLLMKFYEINSGDILIDDVSIKDLTRENIHDLFIMVLQDTWLFNGTIKENVSFNTTDVTDEQIWNALKVVGVEHFIKTLPGNINYNIGNTESISQGQKQLLTIARGMIKNAPLLILDEATSNVDTRTEEIVQKAMDKLTEGRTSFIIAHRLSTIKNADLILVMKNGNIVEQGTHEELLAKDGFYAELYNSQFEL